MKPATKKKILIGCGTVAFLTVLVIAAAAWLLLRTDYESALSTTREWARLAPLPATAVNLKIETRGSMFTREFAVEFEAPPADIDKWLAESAGTKGVQPSVQPDGSFLFEIKPGGGAQFAALTLSKDRKKVKIRTYWS